MKVEKHPAPDHLSERSKALWNELVPRRAKSPERLALLQVALEALDRADLARDAVANEGMVSKTESTGALHVHPLVRVEREGRQLFVKCWDTLYFSWDPRIDGNNL